MHSITPIVINMAKNTIPNTDAFLFDGHTLDINFAQAGHIGPWARPETARHKQ